MSSIFQIIFPDSKQFAHEALIRQILNCIGSLRQAITFLLNFCRKIFDPLLTPLKLPPETTLGFIRKALESAVPRHQVEALSWLQVVLHSLSLAMKTKHNLTCEQAPGWVQCELAESGLGRVGEILDLAVNGSPLLGAFSQPEYNQKARFNLCCSLERGLRSSQRRESGEELEKPLIIVEPNSKLVQQHSAKSLWNSSKYS